MLPLEPPQEPWPQLRKCCRMPLKSLPAPKTKGCPSGCKVRTQCPRKHPICCPASYGPMAGRVAAPHYQ